MQSPLLHIKGHRSALLNIPVEDIDPNPNQPRCRFDDGELEELANSIKACGIISPLNVRTRYGRYELVSGERRLRAAKRLGLRTVPCVVMDVGLEESGMLALTENLQRSDLDFTEEARGIENLIRLYGLSQEETARRLGKSQSAIANKLRLLKLPPDVLAALREQGLTERHGRALLRLPTPNEMREALGEIMARGLNVAQTDAYIDRLLETHESEKGPGRRAFILKDVRVFLNTLSHSLDVMKQGGIAADMKKLETDTELVVTISIPKARPPRPDSQPPTLSESAEPDEALLSLAAAD